MHSVKELQEQACSAYDRRKFCTYDVEFIDGNTIPLIHQTARFWLVKKGKARITVNGEAYEARADSFFCILPWSTTTVDEVEEPMTLIKVVFDFDLIYMSLRTGYNTVGNTLKIYDPMRKYPVIYLNDEEKAAFYGCMEEIRRETGVESLLESEDKAAVSSLMITNKIMEIFILFNRHLLDAGKNTRDSGEDKRQEILSYIYSHIAEYPTASNLADVFELTEKVINEEVDELTGMSLSALENEMRISKTTDLLIYTDLALTDIAFLVGFSDASHLVRTFEARTGYTPKQYRKIYSIQGDNPGYDSREVGFRIVNYIGDHYTEDIHSSDVAEKFGLSVVEMNKMLINIVEKNFDAFLTYLRVNKASRLLLETHDSLVDIAIAVGYNNVKTFNRNFTKERGETPGEFRKNFHLQEI